MRILFILLLYVYIWSTSDCLFECSIVMGLGLQLVNFLLFLSSLAAYGAYVRPMPYSNEIGLRMLIGGVTREAAVLGYHITPLFSYYAFHGPVFRVLLRLNRGKIHDTRYCIIVSVLNLAFLFFCLCLCASSRFIAMCFYSCIDYFCDSYRHYGYIGYCQQCGNSHEFSWDQLGQISCSCNVSKVWSCLFETSSLRFVHICEFNLCCQGIVSDNPSQNYMIFYSSVFFSLKLLLKQLLHKK